jgi:hypothetical protein
MVVGLNVSEPSANLRISLNKNKILAMSGRVKTFKKINDPVSIEKQFQINFNMSSKCLVSNRL